MTDQIFISYRRDDAAYVTGHINDLLRKEFGEDAVFTDVDNIALGVDFRSVLDQTVSECQVLLAVIGPDWLTVRDQDGELRLQDPADFVRIEIESALQRNIPVIPLLVAGATMPTAEELPDSLRGLAFRNGTQIRPAPDFSVDMTRLIKNLQRHFVEVPAAAEDGIGLQVDSDPTQDAEPDEKKPSGISINVGEEDRTRRAELGLDRRDPKKGWFARLRLIVVVLIVGAALYYVGRNQEALEEVLSTDEPEMVDAELVFDEDVDAAASFAETPDSAAEAQTETDAEVVEPEAESSAEPVAEVSDGATFEPTGETEAEAEVESEAGDVAEPVEDVVATEAEAVATPEPEPGPQQPGASELIAEGVRLAALGDHEAAIQVFDEAIQLDDEQSFFYKQRGASYQAMRQFEAAISDFNEAIRLNSEDVNAYYSRGASHQALEDYEAAIADFDIVIEADPGFTSAYSRRADAHEAMGNMDAAERDREDATEF